MSRNSSNSATAPALVPRGNKLELRGNWTVAHATELDALTSRLGQDTVAIDLSGLSECDSYGAAALARLAGSGRRLLNMPVRFSALLDLGAQHQAAPAAPAPAREPLRASFASALAPVSALGESILGGLTTRRHRMRALSMLHHIDCVGVRAIPVVTLITFVMGAIIAQQGFFHFRKFGAEDYVVDLLAVLTIREIAVLLVAIMVAGRSGSAYTAELGSMRMREEIDALKATGVNPGDILLAPRLLALVLSLPVLAFLGMLAALAGGGVVAALYGEISPTVFLGRLAESITADHLKVGLIKAPFMALAIGAIAIAEGLKVEGSAESLGAHTTASVVKAIFMVIIVDGVFAMFFAAMGL